MHVFKYNHYNIIIIIIGIKIPISVFSVGFLSESLCEKEKKDMNYL